MFDVNATGVRGLFIFKNGVGTYVGQASALVPATATLNSQLSVTTPILDVAPGDVFTLVLYQNAGAAINAQANTTSLGLEVVG